MSETAIVLFSGGQDSATCLAWALERFDKVETVGFDYGQTHNIELEIRKIFLEKLQAEFPKWALKLGDDHMIDANVLNTLNQTALTTKRAIEFDESGLPNTFVPGRNILFFTLAAALAFRRDAKHLVGGMCETDYSGYPDCRDDTLKSLQVALGLGMDKRYVIHTPLMWIDKAQTWELTKQLGGNALIELIRKDTHSCYKGDREQLHEWGYGCGACPACELRASGWSKFIGFHKQ